MAGLIRGVTIAVIATLPACDGAKRQFWEMGRPSETITGDPQAAAANVRVFDDTRLCSFGRLTPRLANQMNSDGEKFFLPEVDFASALRERGKGVFDRDQATRAINFGTTDGYRGGIARRYCQDDGRNILIHQSADLVGGHVVITSVIRQRSSGAAYVLRAVDLSLPPIGIDGVGDDRAYLRAAQLRLELAEASRSAGRRLTDSLRWSR